MIGKDFDRREFLKYLGLGAISLSLSGNSITKPRPNIIFILVDDLGWSDPHCYGNKIIETPNIDHFMTQGIHFTNAYAPAPICSATRASLLTGRSPARLHFEFVSKEKGAPIPDNTKLIQPPYTQNLPLQEVTIAEVLKKAGYVTGMYGKWHLTQQNDHYLGWGNITGPLQQGFDEGSEERGSHPYSYYKDKSKRKFLDLKKGEYEPDALTENAIRFMKRHKNEPFFLYISTYYVHTPVFTRCKWLFDKYKRKMGPDASRDKILYAAFVDTMDHYLGQIFTAMDDLGLTENTVVMLMSDNGGHPRYTDNAPLRGSKWTLYEGGIREPMIVRWPGVVVPGSVCHTPVIGMDFFPTFCEIAGIRPNPDIPLDGISILPVLRNPKAKLNRDSLVWHFPYYHPKFVDTRPVSAIRKGDYKLIHFYEDNRDELYNLAVDIGEKNDLSGKLPEKVEKLRQELFDKLKSENARFPKPNPNYKEK